jgi:hypothetical protein
LYNKRIYSGLVEKGSTIVRMSGVAMFRGSIEIGKEGVVENG